MLRDRDRIFAGEFPKEVKAIGITEVLSAASIPVAACLRGTRHRHHSPRVPRPCHRSQRGFPVPAREVLLGVLSRIQDAPVAGQGRARTWARARAGTRTRHFHTASSRTSPPLRATRSLNMAVLAAIPTQGQVFQFSLSVTTRFPCWQIAPWATRVSRFFPEKIAQACDLQPVCGGRLSAQMRFAVGTVD